MRRKRLATGAVVLVMSLAGCAGGAAESDERGAGGEKNGAGGASTGPARPSRVPALVAGMSLEEKVGQLFVPTVGGTSAAVSMIKRYRLGGVIYFPQNTRTPAQTARLSNSLQRASKIPLVIGVDQENGIVSRLPYVTRFPGNMALGATRQPDDVRAAATVTGAELRAVGINLNYAPVADVNVNPANPVIGVRSFGSDPAQVSRLLGAAIQGYQQAGVAATAKHFPGHGDTATDSHTGLPVITHSARTWERIDAPPFRAAVQGGVDAIMSAHIVMPGLDRSRQPATLSRGILTGVLRGRLGFRGVAVTDSLEMAGVRGRAGDGPVAVRAVRAGADQLLMPPDLPTAYRAVLRAVRGGTISKARLDEAVGRILRLKEARGMFGGARADPARAAAIIGSAEHRATATRVAEHAVTLVTNARGLLPLRGRKAYVIGPQAAALAGALRGAGVRTVTSPRAADVAVLTTLDAKAATEPRVRQVRRSSGRPVVVAALGAPYDLGFAGGADASLATYSSAAVSIRALAKVMAGQVRPTGRLPVAVRGHRPGHGLSFPS